MWLREPLSEAQFPSLQNSDIRRRVALGIIFSEYGHNSDSSFSVNLCMEAARTLLQYKVLQESQSCAGGHLYSQVALQWER